MRIALLLLTVGCAGSLNAYERDPNEGGSASGTATATGTGTGTATGSATGSATGTATGTATGSTTATGSGTGTGTGTTSSWSYTTGTGATTGTGTGTGAGTGGGTGTGTGSTGTGTGTTVTYPAAPLIDGTYTGPIDIYYSINLLGQCTCNGTVTMTVDLAAVPPISGTIDQCEFGPLCFPLAQVDDIYGSFDGYNPLYGTVSGSVDAWDASGQVDVQADAWAGVVTTGFSGPRVIGDFSGSRLFTDSWDATFDVVWVSP